MTESKITHVSGLNQQLFFKQPNSVSIDVFTSMDEKERDLLLELAERLNFALTVVTKTKETKIIKGVVSCNFCGSHKEQYFQMSKYSDGSWLKERELLETENLELANGVFEIATLRFDSCWICQAAQEKALHVREYESYMEGK